MVAGSQTPSGACPSDCHDVRCAEMVVAVVKGGRVLVVDDDPMVRDTLAHVLADEGYVVDTAIDGADALECVRLARPDAILLDLMMPGMNGRQFLQAIRDDA